MKTGEQFKEWRASYRDYVMGPYGRPEDSLLAEMFANARKPLEEENARIAEQLRLCNIDQFNAETEVSRLTAEGKRLTKERDHARETRENYWNAFKKSEDDAIRLAAENKHLREAMMTKQYVSIVKVGDHYGLRFGDGAPFVPVVGSKIELPVVLPKGEVIIG